MGVEKISLSSYAVENPNLIKIASNIFGNQSVIVTIDVKKDFWGKKKIFTHNGKKNTKLNPLDFIKHIESLGVGEIVVNSIDNDGIMEGYDIELLKEIKENVKVPIIALGGAGELSHIKEVFEKSMVDAVACGSMFVYKGHLKGILINYPPYETIQELLKNKIAGKGSNVWH